jgi:hypothetical protein
MRKIYFLTIFATLSLLQKNALSQDIILLRTGEEISSKVLEVGTDEIKYKKWENVDGPSYAIKKGDVFMIKYKNGSKDVFENSKETIKSIISPIGKWVSCDNNEIHVTISKQGDRLLLFFKRDFVEGMSALLTMKAETLFSSDDGIVELVYKTGKERWMITSKLNTPVTLCNLGGNNKVVYEEKRIESENKENGQLQKVSKKIESARYFGDSLSGKRHGKGRMAYQNGDIYEGEWKNDLREGKGKNIYANGNVYEGEWKNDLRNGIGVIKYPGGGTYEGEWKDDLRNGIGVLKYPGGGTYEGEWKDDLRSGKGKNISAAGDIYEGDWVAGMKDGSGTMFFNRTTMMLQQKINTYTYTGQWHDDLPSGIGKIECTDPGNPDIKFLIEGTFVYGSISNGTLTTATPVGKEWDWKETSTFTSISVAEIKNGKLGKFKTVK